MMKKLLLLFVAVLCVISANSQTKPKTATPTPAPQPGKKPTVTYTLRKDFDDKVAELNGRINVALSSANKVREMEEKMGTVSELETKVNEINEILVGAKLKISSTSDSLSKTNMSMDDFRKNTDTKLEALEKQGKTQQMMLYIFLGVSVLLSGIVAYLMMSKLKDTRNTMHKQNENLRTKLHGELEEQTIAIKDETRSIKSRFQDDLSLLKMEVLQRMQNESEGTSAQLAEIMAKLDRLKQ